MKKRLILFSLLCACALFASENILVNPGFTIPNGKTLPAGWNRIGKNATAEIEKDEKGGNILKLVHNDAGTVVIIPTREMKPGVQYQLLVPVKAENGKAYEVFVQSSKPRFITVSTNRVKGTGEWQLVSLPVKMEGFTSIPYAAISTKEAQTILIGTPTLAENRNIIRNATFFQRDKSGLPARFYAADKETKWQAKIEDGAPTILVEGCDNAKKARLIVVNTPVIAGKKYTFSADFKAEEEDFLKIGYQENAKWKTFESKKNEGNDKWQTISITFTFPEVTKTSYGIISCYGTEAIAIRNISLVETPEE